MSKEDIGRIALGAPALQQVVLVSLPDCLPVKQWTRGEGRDSEAVAAHMGSLFGQAVDTARASAARGKALAVTIETEDAVLMIRPLGPEAAAGFVFDRSAPMGLVRMQARQLSGHLASIVPAPRDSQDLSSAPEKQAPVDVSATIIAPRPSVMPTSAPNPAPSRSGEVSAVASKAPAAPRPRAVRLLEFFHRYAPDPHASTLRLSLRTGIGVDQLGNPENLSEDQVEALAVAVRDILGQEQLGF